MKIIESVKEIQEYCQQLKREGKTIASVDTDGELHDGHMTLVKIAKENADVTILSVCHGFHYLEMPEEEYKKKKFQYRHSPEGLSKDVELCRQHGIDVFCYLPENQLYADDFVIPLEICEKTYDFIRSRGMFDEVVVSRFVHSLWTWFPPFYVLTPDICMVGQKDAYQNFAIKSLIKQLNLPIEVVIAPIIRDPDGLACSSRNVHLTQSERQDATSIYQVLQEVASWTEIEPINYIKSYITHHVKSEYCYVDICCSKTLKILDVLDREAIIIINAFFGEIELGDNIIIKS
tara:strand:+ start:256 stop:1125 length:870 start_codon:yes stop_codon:yes gene_type:complete